jgi:hypothetical protein
MGRRTANVSLGGNYELGWTYLGNGCSEHNNFVQLAHSLHKLVDTRTLDNIHVMVLAFNLDGNGEVGLVQDLANSQYQAKN